MKSIKFLTICFCLLLISGCNEDGMTGPVLDRLIITSSNGSRLDIAQVNSTQLSISGRDASNNEVNITGSVVWEVNNSNAAVNQNGLVELLSVGPVTVVASVGEVKAGFELSIWNSQLPRTEIFVSDAGPNYQAPWQILRAFEDGSHFEVFTSQNLNWPQDIIILEEEGLALISNLSGNNITQYDLKDGRFKGVFASGISGPTRMEFGPDQLLYVLPWQGDGLVRRFEQDGTALGPFTDIAIPQSIGMAWDADGNLYVSSYSDGNGSSFVHRFDPEGKDLGVFIGSNIQGATDIWFEGEDLLVNDYPQGIVKRFDSSGQFLGNFITGLNLNEGIDHLLNGNILIGNGGSKAVKMYTPEGEFVKDVVPAGTLNLALPNAVTVREVNR